MTKHTFEDTVNNFLDFLEEALPNVDTTHRNEVLDIAELLKQRAYQFVNNYGLN